MQYLSSLLAVVLCKIETIILERKQMQVQLNVHSFKKRSCYIFSEVRMIMFTILQCYVQQEITRFPEYHPMYDFGSYYYLPLHQLVGIGSPPLFPGQHLTFCLYFAI